MANDRASLTARLIAFVRSVYDSYKDYDDVNDEVQKMVADAKAIIDEAESYGPFRYTLKYRPPSQATLPREPWELVEIPKAVSHHYHRPGLPISMYSFGVVEFKRRLSTEEVSQYEMERVWP